MAASRAPDPARRAKVVRRRAPPAAAAAQRAFLIRGRIDRSLRAQTPAAAAAAPPLPKPSRADARGAPAAPAGCRRGERVFFQENTDAPPPPLRRPEPHGCGDDPNPDPVPATPVSSSSSSSTLFSFSAAASMSSPRVPRSVGSSSGSCGLTSETDDASTEAPASPPPARPARRSTKRQNALWQLKTLGCRGVHPRLLQGGYTVEVPQAARRVVRDAVRGNARRPCAAVTQLHVGGAGAVRVFDDIPLTADGVALRDTPNAGGASVRSEVLSVEVLKRVFGAELLATEMEVTYWPPNSPITDYVCTLEGQPIGVSVTRAFHFVSDDQFTPEFADRLLKKKLQGVLNSTSAVVYPSFSKQVLHAFCPSKPVARTLLQQYRCLASELRANTVLLVTIAAAEWIYTETKDVPKAPKAPKPAAAPPQPQPQPKKQRKKKRKRRVTATYVARVVYYSALHSVQWAASCAAAAAANTASAFGAIWSDGVVAAATAAAAASVV